MSVPVSLVFFFLLTLCAGSVTAGPVKGKKFSISTVGYGHGRVAFFWPPSPLFYTGGGWKLVDRTSGKTVAHWNRDDLATGMAALDPEQQERLQPFLKELGSDKDKKQKKTMTSLLYMGAMTDFSTAVKLGMGCVVEGLSKGGHRYRLILLDAKGKSTGQKLTSGAIDAHQETPLPPAIQHLRAKTGRNGMELFWDSNPSVVFAPFVQIERRTALEDKTVLLNQGQPIWIPGDRDPNLAAYLDMKAPLETKLTYTVVRQDIFGRRSRPATITLMNEDIDALSPPDTIETKAGKDRIKISWQAKTNPLTAGYIIERSRRANGIYEVLTTRGLPRSTEHYLDKTAQGGFTWYYRIRSIGPRGDVGLPSDPVADQAQPDGRPEPPKKLTAEVQPTRVILHWQPQPLPVAGYIVEKKKKDDSTWVRLNSSLTTLTRFEDPVNLGDFGQRRYRITSVAFANLQSRPGKELTVTLPGHALVPAPFLSDITSKNGVVELSFHASSPVAQIESMLLVRGNSLRDSGLVIGRNLDRSAHSYLDKLVKPGQDYWYALIALDKENHRSDLGNKLFIRVAPTAIPRPGKPKVRLKEKPFRRVIISFEEPKGFLQASVMRRVESGTWVTVAADIAGTGEIVDADPPLSGNVSYRVAFVDEARNWGEPSKPVTLSLEK